MHEHIEEEVHDLLMDVCSLEQASTRIVHLARSCRLCRLLRNIKFVSTTLKVAVNDAKLFQSFFGQIRTVYENTNSQLHLQVVNKYIIQFSDFIVFYGDHKWLCWISYKYLRFKIKCSIYCTKYCCVNCIL